ncbi:Transposase [Chitinispirillum alkaliphilum]|nr:Transposase [Chitinispirillum alkaliphilum]
MSTRKMQNYVVKSKKIFVGLEDSKKTWKITVRCDKREIHYTSMQARYANLLNYFRNKFPDCDITVIYEAGFKGFGLHDQLVSDDIACIVTPPNKVTQEKHTRVKTDKIDSRRLATVLENGDYKSCRVPDSERRSDRTISRSLTQLQKEITRMKNRIRKFFDANGYAEIFPAGAWSEKDYRTARELELPTSLMIAVESYWEILDKYVQVKKRLLKQMNNLAKKERYAKAVSIIQSFDI